MAEALTEYYQHSAGLKPTMEMTRVYDHYAHLTSLESALELAAMGAPTELQRFAAEAYVGDGTKQLTDQVGQPRGQPDGAVRRRAGALPAGAPAAPERARRGPPARAVPEPLRGHRAPPEPGAGRARGARTGADGRAGRAHGAVAVRAARVRPGRAGRAHRGVPGGDGVAVHGRARPPAAQPAGRVARRGGPVRPVAADARARVRRRLPGRARAAGAARDADPGSESTSTGSPTWSWTWRRGRARYPAPSARRSGCPTGWCWWCCRRAARRTTPRCSTRPGTRSTSRTRGARCLPRNGCWATTR